MRTLSSRLIRVLALPLLAWFALSCTGPLGLTVAPSAAPAARSIGGSLPVTGPQGTVVVSGMSGTSLTVSYTPAAAITSAKLYVTQGNGTGLVLASQAMTDNGGTWSWTFSHPTFTAGAKIGLDVLQNRNGAETNVPQGSLGDATSWASFSYGTTVTGFTVTFDGQGATTAPVPGSLVVAAPATTVGSLPSPPAKTGSTFLGWFTAPTGGTAFTATTPVTADLTVYAQWKPTGGNGGLVLTGPNGSVTLSAMTNTSLTVTYVPSGSITSANLFLTQGNGTGLVLASQTMMKTGGTWSFTFSHPSFTLGAKVGVDVLQNASGLETNVPQGTLANSSTWASFLYGIVPVSSTVTYDSQGATVPASPASQTVTTPATTVGTLPAAPKKSGYAFLGWFTAASGGTAFLANTPVTADLTVYARWTAVVPATVTFDSVGATVPASPSTLTVDTGSPVGTLPSEPQKTGQTFQGWLQADGTPFVASTPVAGTMTVTAKWGTNPADTLLALNPGMHMTMQFNNKTNGAWRDDQVYLTMLARDSAGLWCWVKPNGTLQRMSTGDNGQLTKNGRLCANYSIPLNTMQGFQLPATVDSGRVFVSLGSPLYLTVVVDGNGQIGYAAPDLNNATDPNADVYFDWYEFAIAKAGWVEGSPVGFWGNTTQVDQLSIPLMARVYEKNGTAGGSFLGANGISESRTSLWAAWDAGVPAEFKALKNAYRINAPCKDKVNGFGVGSAKASYFDAYVNQIWDQYRTQDLTFRMDFGGASHLYKGRVQGDAFVFTQDGQGSIVAVARKPNATEIFEASGVLATGNTLEGAIQARIDAALNRHVMENSALWDMPSAFYQAVVTNHYAKFMHEHAFGGGAYGFAYDDVGNFSGALYSYNGRAVVIDIGW